MAMTLAVNMMMYNEAAYLSMVIPRLKEMADYLIVQDNGSTDRSIDVATSLLDRACDTLICTHQGETPNYATLRNNMLCHVPDGTWVLKWDPDELPSDELIGLKAYLNTLNPDINLIGIPIYHLVNDTDALGIEYGFCHLRLFRKFPDSTFAGNIHEQIITRGAIHNIPESLRMAVMHLSYYSIRRLRRKEEFYACLPNSGHGIGTLERNIRNGTKPLPKGLEWSAPQEWKEVIRKL